MANKTHCDVCDETPASSDCDKAVAWPGRSFSTRNQLTVNVTVYGQNEGEGRPAKDVCDRCRAILVADAFGLRTPEEFNVLRDELNDAKRRIEDLESLQAALAPPTPPASSVSGLTSPTVPDPDIPF